MENLKTSNAKITIDIDYDGTYAYYEIGDIDLALSIKFDYDGRCQFLLIEPSFFASDEEEKYYNENWEQIESEITEAYYNLQK
jgi:hypothetical protein